MLPSAGVVDVHLLSESVMGREGRPCLIDVCPKGSCVLSDSKLLCQATCGRAVLRGCALQHPESLACAFLLVREIVDDAR